MQTEHSTAAIAPPDSDPDEQLELEGQQFVLTEPLRPELEPGTSVTYKPDRWCAACQEARASKRCVVCRAVTVPNTVNAGQPQVMDPAELARRDLAQLELEQGALAGIDDDREPEPERAPRRPYVRDVSAPRAPQDSRFNPRARQQERPPMKPQQRYQRDYDDEGRQYGGTRGRVTTPQEQLDTLWVKAIVDEVKWSSFAAGFAAGGASPLEAANMADDLYAELIARQAFAVQGPQKRR
jgi:hypothetical protein